MLGDLAEPGVYPVNTATTRPTPSKRLFDRSKGRVKFDGKKRGDHAAPLSEEAMARSGEPLVKVIGRSEGLVEVVSPW